VALLEGTIHEGDHVLVDADEDHLTFEPVDTVAMA
jgi:hypothetical protein